MICSTRPSECFRSNGPGGRRDEHHVGDVGEELGELEGPIVPAGGQAPPELDECVLAGPVPQEHPPDLGNGDVGLVDEDEEILRKEVEQRVRRLARLSTREVARVVLDAGAVAGLSRIISMLYSVPASRTSRPTSRVESRARRRTRY